jgi:hypothetical protein
MSRQLSVACSAQILSFQYPGRRCRLATAIIRSIPDFIWKMTPYGNRLARQRLVFFDIGDHASGYSEIREIVA